MELGLSLKCGEQERFLASGFQILEEAFSIFDKSDY